MALVYSLGRSTPTTDNYSLKRLLYIHWAVKLLPQLLMEQFDTLPIQYRHIEHMHEGVWLKKIFFDKMTAMRT